LIAPERSFSSVVEFHPHARDGFTGRRQVLPDVNRTFEERFLPRIDQFLEMDPDELRGEIDTDFPIDQEVLEDPPLDFDVDDGLSLRVPCSWATQLPAYEHYEGWMWHTRRFEWDDSDDRGFLQFGAVNYAAGVWLNGEHVGSHEGGFTPFSFEVTDHLEPENLLVVRVDNERRESGLPTPNTDWFNFGGINRSVELVTVPGSYLRNFRIDTALDGDEGAVRVHVWTDAPALAEAPELSIPARSVETTLERVDGDDEASTL